MRMIRPETIFAFAALEQKEGSWQTDWQVPHHCAYFDGHFPNLPIMPAVALLDGSLELIRKSGAVPAEALTLKKAKFTGMITPGMKLTLRLLHKENRFDLEWLKAGTADCLATFSFLKP